MFFSDGGRFSVLHPSIICIILPVHKIYFSSFGQMWMITWDLVESFGIKGSHLLSKFNFWPLEICKAFAF